MRLLFDVTILFMTRERVLKFLQKKPGTSRITNSINRRFDTIILPVLRAKILLNKIRNMNEQQK